MVKIYNMMGYDHEGNNGISIDNNIFNINMNEKQPRSLGQSDL